MICLVFYSTNSVFEAEELLNGCSIATEVAPTPVQDKGYCGICLTIQQDDVDAAKAVLESVTYRLVKRGEL